MLGIEDRSVLWAYLLCIASAVLCLIYGLITWNRGDDTVTHEDFEWAKDEKRVDQDM